MKQRFSLLSTAIFGFGSWFVGDFIGLFTHPNLLELLLLFAFALGVGWRLMVAEDRSDLIRKLALMMVSLSITLALVEVWFVRQVVSISPERAAKLVATNTSVRSVPVERTPGHFRVLGLADSFGSIGGEKNYHYLVKEQLTNEGTSPLELINASSPGTAPKDHLYLYRAFAHYRPDLVLYGFYTGNDFDKPDGLLVQYHGVTWRHYFSWKEFRPRHFMVRKWLYRLFQAGLKVGPVTLWRGEPEELGRVALRREELEELGRLVLERGELEELGRLALERGELEKPGGVAPSREQLEKLGRLALEKGMFRKGLLPHDFYLQIERSNFVTNFRRMDDLEKRWSHTRQMLDIIRKEVEQHGGSFVLVIHPDRVQVDRMLREELYKNFGLSEADFDLGQPQRFLLNWCKSRGVLCLDLLPIFKAQGDGGPIYLLDDIHYNSKGNAIAAGAITRWLLADEIVPKQLRH